MLKVPRRTSISSHIETLAGAAVVATNPVAGGDICVSTRARLSDGRSVFVKSRPGIPDDFFAAEARGLQWLADAQRETDAETVRTPTVLGHNRECLVLEWVESGRPSAEAAEDLGRALAETHRVGAPHFGAPYDGYAGMLPLPNTQSDKWSEFFATQRIEPYLRAAFNRGNLEAEDANSVVAVLERLGDLGGPEEPPARIHGDLWSGNVIWATEGTPRVVDPAAHGGHREADLAMLGLFGAPYLDRLIAAYNDVFPLAAGWRERQALHQLHPLLVHAALFGGAYGARAGRAARDLMSLRANATSPTS